MTHRSNISQSPKIHCDTLRKPQSNHSHLPSNRLKSPTATPYHHLPLPETTTHPIPCHQSQSNPTNRLPIPALPSKHLRRRARVRAHISRENADSMPTARVDRAHLPIGTSRILRAAGLAAGRGAVDADARVGGRGDADAFFVVAAGDEVFAVGGGAAGGYWDGCDDKGVRRRVRVV